MMSHDFEQITNQLLEKRARLEKALSHLRSLKYYKRSVENHQRNFSEAIASLNKAINKQL